MCSSNSKNETISIKSALEKLSELNKLIDDPTIDSEEYVVKECNELIRKLDNTIAYSRSRKSPESTPQEHQKK